MQDAVAPAREAESHAVGNDRPPGLAPVDVLARADSRLDPLIQVRGLGKTFDGRNGATEALRGIDLDVGRGEFISLLGPSGCGKSTLLRIFGGLVEADRGNATVGGVGPRVARSQKRFGFVPQVPALLPWRTVRDNVRLLADVNPRVSASHPLSQARVSELLDSVGLSQFVSSRPDELSGGMQQRVSLVRAFALGAPILLMDEPFASLDEITRSEMRYLLLDLWERSGTTVVFVTHSVAEAVILSDRIVVLTSRPGRIAAAEQVTLARPRNVDMEDTEAFHDHVRRLRHELRLGHAR